jgi:hypothetical protein
MVTAELVVALPALVLVLAFALSAVGAVSTRMRAADAAAVAARLAARGESAAVVREAWRLAAPAGASMRVSHPASGFVAVTVATPVRLAVAGLRLPGARVAVTQVMPLEPSGPSR